MLVTPSGIVTEVNWLHKANAKSPILVTPAGIVIDVNPEQPENAELPILVTLSGIVTDVSPEQSRNAASPMPVTVNPSITFGILTVLSDNEHLVIVASFPEPDQVQPSMGIQVA